MGFLESLFGAGNDHIEAVITDVTRMQGDKVCVAAMHKGKSLRLHDPQPRGEWLQSIGGLAPGDLVSLRWKASRRYRRPHSEDGDWSPARFEKTGHVSEGDLRNHLGSEAYASVREAFGRPKFYTERGNAAFHPDSGSRSLASLLVRSLKVYRFGDGVRADFVDDAAGWKMVPVVDLALRNGQHGRGMEADRAVLRIGIGRPYQAPDMPLGCYLQVNHVFPVGTLTPNPSPDARERGEQLSPSRGSKE